MFNYLFPIETINRELDPKLMVAVNVVDAKSEIYLGQHDYVHRLLGRMRHGVYFGKNCFRGREAESLEVLKRLKASDFRTFYLHEEGAVFPPPEDGWRNVMRSQYDPSLLDARDKVFVWGETQQAFDLSRRGDSGVPVEAVGHPRFDLYKEAYRDYYQPSIERLRSKYGPYVLINTNFGMVNAAAPWRVFLRRRFNSERRFIEIGTEFFRFLELLFPLVQAFPKVQFVLRSHPSEQDETYIELFKKHPNVLIRHEGPVAPWIFGAECLVHAGCTTAVEAWFAGVPSLDYSTVPDSSLTAEASRRCNRAEEVIQQLADALAHGPTRAQLPQLSDRARRMLRNVDADALDALTHHLRQANDGVGEGLTHAELRASYHFHWARERAAAVKSRLHADIRGRRVYDAKKFQGFTRESIERSVRAANQVLGRNAVVRYCDPMLVVLGTHN